MKKVFFALVFSVLVSGLMAQVAYNHGQLLVQLTKKAVPADVEADVTAHVGIRPQFKAGELVSDIMRVWLFTFDESEISMPEMMRAVKNSPGVSVVQANHILQDRNTPNDPFYGQQWFHNNANDKDIDTDLAWDITTGGTTAFGDEIVVCVVEGGGAKWNEADIVDNHWTNTNEIAGNGVDDDNNGYVDDVDGWNLSTTNDVIGTATHGTQVSSMIGAKGNNGLGITGVNWNVKIMQVQSGSVNESSVIASYTYPLKMRKLYNETAGQRGAFVVATNSSWGIDNGQPADAPLWCAFYDSLGYYGVLSCAATANNNVNIDNVGDLPTACPSEYLISVTATNNNDLRTFSGYGATMIDLGAPGESVYLESVGTYGNTSGTSFASPCVAGAVALLYSAPCTSFMSIAHADPALGAQMIRDYIFNGVDLASNLTTECVTGGRLNVNNSLNLLINGCSASDCIVPFAVHEHQQPASLNYTFSWGNTGSMTSFALRYRIVGSGTWIVLDNLTTANVNVNDLQSCSYYEYQVMAYCSNGSQSDWSTLETFTTDGCCTNPNSPNISNIVGSSAEVHWQPILAASGYTIHLIPSNGPEQIINATDNQYTLTDLLPCTSYSVVVYSNCAGPELPPPSPVQFTTSGCATCQQNNYCASSGNTQYEFIQSVQVGLEHLDSGDDGGYHDYSAVQSFLIEPLHEYSVVLTPGFSSLAYPEYFKMWIDYNDDGVYDNTSEVVFESTAGQPSAVNGQFTAPNFTGSHAVGMRVSMAYHTSSSQNFVPEPCSDMSTNGGEVEDYCAYLQGPTGVSELLQKAELSVYPNPANESVTVQLSGVSAQALCKVYGATGELIFSERAMSTNVWDVSNWANGIYTIVVIDGATSRTSKLTVVR